jgi:predicted permease
VEILSDIRFVLRVFARRPGVPLLLAALFALGVGLASGMWAVIDAAVLRPLPYRDGEALVVVMETHPQRGVMAVTPANFLDWATRVRSLQNVAGEYAVDVSVTGAGLPERVAGTKVTERFFDLWGVPAAVGRNLQANDFTERHRVVVLGHALWARQFGADPRVIGALIHIDAETYTVIGVMPRGFRTVGNAEIWIPWTMSPDEQRERRFHLVRTIGRLHSGVSVAEAESELDTIYGQPETDYPESTAHWSARVQPLRDLLLGDSARALMVLGGAVLVLVVVAWINVAGLLLAWLPSRRQEFLVRIALGATTTRVVRQLLLETSVWATAGLAAGLAIARWFVRLFGAVGVSTALPYDFEPRVDARVMLATAALLLVSVGVTAVGPCVLAVHRSQDLVPRRAWATGGLGRRITVAMQVALSMVLLSAATGLLVGFHHLSALATPAIAGSTLAMEISRSEMRQSDDSDNRRFFGGLLAALGERGEVRAVAAASYVPPTPPLGNVRFSIEGRATSTDAQTALASAVSASAFRLLGITLVRGRLIEDGDLQNAPYVAVISATLSRRYWPNENPIGRRIVLVGTDNPVTVVGVVADVRQPLSKDPRAESVLYLSYQQLPWPFMTLIFAPSEGPSAAVAAVRQEVARLDPSQAAGSIQVLDDLRTEWLGQPRLQTTVVALFGLATLFLTLVGLYAQVAHGVAVRAREFAIRQALGARPADVVRQLTVEALLVVAGGVLAGLGLLPLTTWALRSLVIDAQSLDFRLVAGVACLLGLCALASAYWPARRVGRIDPAELLKAEQ